MFPQIPSQEWLQSVANQHQRNVEDGIDGTLVQYLTDYLQAYYDIASQEEDALIGLFFQNGYWVTIVGDREEFFSFEYGEQTYIETDATSEFPAWEDEEPF